MIQGLCGLVFSEASFFDFCTASFSRCSLVSLCYIFISKCSSSSTSIILTRACSNGLSLNGALKTIFKYSYILRCFGQDFNTWIWKYGKRDNLVHNNLYENTLCKCVGFFQMTKVRLNYAYYGPFFQVKSFPSKLIFLKIKWVLQILIEMAMLKNIFDVVSTSSYSLFYSWDPWNLAAIYATTIPNLESMFSGQSYTWLFILLKLDMSLKKLSDYLNHVGK